MAEVQQTFDWKRSHKLWMLERLQCPLQIKGLLKALDGFARDDRATTQTLRRLAQSMGCSQDTSRRAVKAAERLGYLAVDRTNKSASTYAIVWLPIFEQTQEVEGQNSATASGATPPWQSASPPLQNASPPPGNLQGAPLQIARGAPPPTIPTNSRPYHGAGGVAGPRRKSEDRLREARPGKGSEPTQIGDLFSQIAQTNSVQPQATVTTPWVGHIDRRDLGDLTLLQVLTRRAIAGGIIPPGREGLLIVLAAAHHARTASGVHNPGGLFKGIVEGKCRFRLAETDYRAARETLRSLTAPTNSALTNAGGAQ